MKIRFIGDPRYPDEPAKAADPEVMVYFGKEFPKHKWVSLDDAADKMWLEQHGDNLRVNSHFEVSGKMLETETPKSKEDYSFKADVKTDNKTDKE